MFKSLYDQERFNKNNTDGIREYCKAEHLNEEHFRSSIRTSDLEYKTNSKKMILAIVIFSIILFGIGYIYNASSETKNGAISESQAIGMTIKSSRDWEPNALEEPLFCSSAVGYVQMKM